MRFKILLLTLLIFVFSSFAIAETIDDFETGVFGSDWIDLSVSGVAVINSVSPINGSYDLKLIDAITSGEGVIVEHHLDQNYTFIDEFCLNVKADANTQNQGFSLMQDVIYDVADYGANRLLLVAFRETGRIMYYDTAYRDLQGYTGGTTYNVCLKNVNTSSYTYDIWIDGSSVKTGASFMNNLGNVEGFYFYAHSGSYTGTTYIDDIYVNNRTIITNNNFTITAKSFWDNSSLSNFSANVNGTLYNTTNGTIITNILDNNTNLYNITIYTPDRFNYTTLNYNISDSGNLVGYLKQSQINFSVIRAFDLTTISNYTIVIDGQTFNVTGSSYIIYPDAGNYTVTSITDNTGVETYSLVDDSFSVSALDNKSVNFTVAGHTINVKALNVLNNISISNFTVNLTGINFTDVRSNTTTSGVSTFKVNDGSFNLTIDADGYALVNNSIILVVDNSKEEWNVTFNLTPTNSIRLYFYDEDLPTSLFTGNVSFVLINGGATNYTTSNGTYFLQDLSSGDYEIKYTSSGFDSRSYFFTVSPRSTQTINLYLSNSSLTENYIIRVADQSDTNIVSAIVKLQRQMINLNGSYVTIEECTTNSDGECDMFIQESSSINYRFIVVIDGEVVKTTETLNIVNIPTESKSITIRVDTGTSLYQAYKDLKNIFYVLTINSNNDTVTWSVVDSGNMITGGCLNLKSRDVFESNRSTVFEQCSNLTSFTFSKNFSSYLLNDTVLYLNGQIYYNDLVRVTLDSVQIRTQTKGSNIDPSDDLLMLVILFVFISLLSVMIPNMIIQTVLNFGLLLFADFLGVGLVGKVTIIGFLLLGLVLNYNKRNVSVTGV